MLSHMLFMFGLIIALLSQNPICNDNSIQSSYKRQMYLIWCCITKIIGEKANVCWFKTLVFKYYSNETSNKVKAENTLKQCF